MIVLFDIHRTGISLAGLFLLLALLCVTSSGRPIADAGDKFYSQMPGERSSFLKVNVKGRIPNTATNQAAAKFAKHYIHPGANPNLDIRDVVVNANAEIIEKLSQPTAAGNDGFAVHYGLSDDGNFIQYLLGAADYDETNEEVSTAPFPADTFYSTADYYILLSSTDPASGSYSYLEENDFCRLAKNYESKMKRIDKNQAANDIALDPNHPNLVYHYVDAFATFYSAYQAQNPSRLYFRHAAFEQPANGEFYHTPILLFGNAVWPFDIDDVVYSNDSSQAAHYRQKGFDSGYLCPPKCDAAPHETCKL